MYVYEEHEEVPDMSWFYQGNFEDPFEDPEFEPGFSDDSRDREQFNANYLNFCLWRRQETERGNPHCPFASSCM